MGNKFKYTKLYNEDFKLRFLDHVQKSQHTYSMYLKTFKKIQPLEELYSKDLYNFSLNEMMDALKTFRFKSEQAMRTRFTPLGQYITFAISEGYTENNINTIDVIRVNKNITSILLNSNAVEQKIITRQNLYEYCDKMKNFQDAAVWILCFESVLGKEKKDIVNLKKDDVDTKDNLIQFDDRIIEISPKSMYFIQGAINEEKYFKLNGKYEDKKGYNNEARYLQKNRYVIRSSGGKLDAFINKPVPVGTINQRLKKTASDYGLPHLSPTDLYFSGILEQVKIYICENVDKDEKNGKNNIVYKELKRFVSKKYPDITQSQLIKARKIALKEIIQD